MKRIYALALVVLLGTSEVVAQPASILTFLGGYSIAMGDLKGKFGSTWQTYQTNPDSNTYFLQNGFNFGMDMKFAPFKDKRFKIIGAVHFTTFSQGAEYADTGLSVQIDYAMRIFSFSVGAEYMYVTKTSRINPFVNGEMTMNLFSGNYGETYSDGGTKDLTLESALRFGLRLGAGVDIPLGRRLGVVVGANYNLANLIGKQSTADFGTQYTLNDKEGIINGEKYENRSINYLNIYAGFSLYLGL